MRKQAALLVSTPEIGTATDIAFLPRGTVQTAAKSIRRGGGSALVQFG